MNLPQKYVITGGPCTGKTSLLKSLAKMGYQTTQEAAPIIMREEKAKGKEIPWDDLIYFQTRVLNKQLEFESKLNPIPIAFVDRGTLDGLAYCRLFKTNPPKNLVEKACNNRYTGVFILDFLSFYKTTKLRTETLDIAHKIHNLIRETYEEYGYEVINVPPLDIEARVNFICAKIKEISVINSSITKKNMVYY